MIYVYFNKCITVDICSSLRDNAQGVQPIISYNFGAGNRERVIKTFKALLIVCLVATMFMGGIAVLFPKFLCKDVY